MTPVALRYRLGELGLSLGGLARLAEVNGRTVRRWCAGKQDIPPRLEGLLDNLTQDEVTEVMGRGMR